MSVSHLSEIITSLYVGNSVASRSGQYTLVVNCTEDLPRHEPHISDQYACISLDDTKTEEMNNKLFENLTQITEQIHAVHSANGKVLIHCHAGISRSVSVAVAYITRYSNLSLIQAIVLVKNRRPLAYSYEGVNFEDALIRFAKQYGKY
jgi:protein-tyrosine phosphatase